MKLTLQRIMEATPVIATIINEKRPMPQKGKYRLARLHAKLYPEFVTGETQRLGMIEAYGYRATVPVGKDEATGEPIMAPAAAHLSVPPDKAEEFRAAWDEIRATVIDVDIEPVPLDQVDLGPHADGAIQAGELLALGELVTE